MKKMLLFVCLLGLGLSLGLIINVNIIYQRKGKITNFNSLSMMLETDYNSNSYVPSTSNEWPTSGYMFNEELSRCEYGSKLSWDDTTNEVLMTGNSSDKCYVYFDKYQAIVINSSSAEASGTSIVITINATAGTGEISKYYYSKDNGKNYIEDTSNTYTFMDLDAGTYKIKYYVEDSNGKKSSIITKEVSITTAYLANYIKSLYTGTQGENNLYYHDSTLTNGAGDNSYRYAGAHDEVNNFVCFGSDDATCPDDNLYRIIGVFGDQVKLIKWDYATTTLLGTDGDYNSTCETSTGNNGLGCYSFTVNSEKKGSNSLATIGAYFWNKDGTNTWSESNLNTINLNKNYVSNIGSKWSSKIATTDWVVGGNSSYDNVVKVNLSTAYINEIVSPEKDTKYRDEIGLMYATDYGFAANPSAWTSTLYTYSDSAIIDVNWMYMGLMEWTITRSTNVILVINTGQLEDSGAWAGINNFGWAVRPTFYLNSDVSFVGSHEGSKTDPYRLN